MQLTDQCCRSGPASRSESNKNQNPDLNPEPHQGDKSNADLHPDQDQIKIRIWIRTSNVNDIETKQKRSDIEAYYRNECKTF